MFHASISTRAMCTSPFLILSASAVNVINSEKNELLVPLTPTLTSSHPPPQAEAEAESESDPGLGAEAQQAAGVNYKINSHVREPVE